MWHRFALGVTVALLVNSAYIGAFASASIFYMANVLLHLALGVAFVALCVAGFSGGTPLRRGALTVVLASAVPALYLILNGNTRDNRGWLEGHVIAAALGMLLLAVALGRKPVWAAFAVFAILPIAMKLKPPDKAHRVVNPIVTPVSMEEEGAGPQGPFWPSSAQTNAGLIPSDYFLDSEQCGTCHKDIYEQWKSSVHHFASFNNQFYRKSIEFMQEKQGSTKPSRWCASCHDHALLFNGRWEKPVKDQIDTPEAQAGLGCLSCHAISQVHNTMGNAGFTLDYNWLHKIAASKNKYVQSFDRFLTYLNPEPHRRTFLKAFHRQDSAEFCSSCHKVHLDVPVNNYRWIRGFNDYDNWQASGVSGRGARSFYYPKESATCNGCHMPLIASNDPGNVNGQVHNHRFLAANTAVPLANNDAEQLELTRKFLESGFITADIFAASPVEDAPNEMKMVRRGGDSGPSARSTFAVGEEAESTGQVFLREVGRVSAPLDKAGTKFQPGSTVRVDVVVRTRKIGHFFPGGTVDGFDVWLELEGKDAAGQHVFWSGRVDDGGKGPVERGAHFYRSYQLDAEGNHINKRNAWQTRSLLYVRLIPPGAADTAHFRVQIPRNAKGHIALTAKLNYRKFAHSYTQFSYENRPDVSGAIKDRVPDVPIVTLARAEAKIELAAPGEKTEWRQVVAKDLYERWNDWGIGMLLQGDLKGAQYAFQKVCESNPEYADGPLNVARALVQEGQTEDARPYIVKALALKPEMARGYFFQAMVQKAAGDYEGALASLRKTEAQHPEDRVVLNQLGRILFLKRDYAAAVASLERVLRVDPEDLQAHYTLMLAYRGLGQNEKADRSAKLFQRFKADEAAQTITAKPRQTSPEDNNERQMIHDHESVALAEAR